MPSPFFGSSWLPQSSWIGLDLGSSMIRFSLPSEKKLLSEPSVVARNTHSDMIVAAGESAKKIMGRTPAHIETIHPIVAGVVDDSEALEALLSIYLYKHSPWLAQFVGRNILVALPAGVTDVDTRIIASMLEQAGARRVEVVAAGVAGLVGVGAPVGDPTAQLIVNIGAGITQAAAVSSGEIIAEASTTLAGNQFDDVIVRHVIDDFGIRVSAQQAEVVKHELAAVRGYSDEPGASMAISGQDEASNLPREITLSRVDITEAIDPLVEDMAGFLEDFLSSLSADMTADISSHGVHLIGGGAGLDGLSEHMSEALGVAIHDRVNPERTLIEGVSYILDRSDGSSLTQAITSYETSQ